MTKFITARFYKPNKGKKIWFGEYHAPSKGGWTYARKRTDTGYLTYQAACQAMKEEMVYDAPIKKREGPLRKYRLSYDPRTLNDS